MKRLPPRGVWHDLLEDEDFSPSKYTVRIGDLINGLSDSNYVDRMMAAQALGKMGTHAINAIPAVRTSLQDENYIVRVEAAAALCRITGSVFEGLPVLIETLHDPDPQVREYGSSTVSSLSLVLKDPALVPVFLEMAESKEFFSRMYAASGLFNVAPNDPQTARILTALSQDADDLVREAANKRIQLIQKIIHPGAGD